MLSRNFITACIATAAFAQTGTTSNKEAIINNANTNGSGLAAQFSRMAGLSQIKATQGRSGEVELPFEKNKTVKEKCPHKKSDKPGNNGKGGNGNNGNGKGNQSRNLLAQTFAQSENHTCTFTQDRNKADVDDFYTLVAATQKYTDDDFTADNSSLFWEDRGEGSSGFAVNTAPYVRW